MKYPVLNDKWAKKVLRCAQDDKEKGQDDKKQGKEGRKRAGIIRNGAGKKTRKAEQEWQKTGLLHICASAPFYLSVFVKNQ